MEKLMLKTEGKFEKNVPDWKELVRNSVNTAEQLSKFLDVDKNEVLEVMKKYPMRINPYFLSLIKEKNDPLWKQCIPDIKEVTDEAGFADPLNEEGDSPVPGLTHRYPDRVLLLVSNQCAMYCRFCTRKRKVGDPIKGRITKEQLMKGIAYISEHKEIRDVILSGGDPLMLDDSRLRALPYIVVEPDIARRYGVGCPETSGAYHLHLHQL